ncbi:MAG: stage II sporulation protein R [Oscillospiraceae bacterium]|jgi:stage II sporulation protein R|nr:stage II sporulation protein R [Oscillospiraceae bacterium]
MTFKKKRNLLTVSMLLGTCLTLLLASFTAFAEYSEIIGGEVLRLHILPHSDCCKDQRLKEQLRDFIIADMEMRFAGTRTLDEAMQIAETHLAEIQKSAALFVAAQGHDYDVTAELVSMYFTTRVYENITMPAGNYAALRITIGAGAGRNWWCVVFPPLCLPAVTGSEPYFSPGVSEVIETGGRIEVRFKVYEWWTKVFG